MVTVRPELNRFFELTGIRIDGKHHRCSFTVDWVAQSTSWLINMQVEFDGQKYNSPEYSDKPMITQELIMLMCYDIESSINSYKHDVPDDYYKNKINEKSEGITCSYTPLKNHN